MTMMDDGGRRRTDIQTPEFAYMYTISSPCEPQGSGELTERCKYRHEISIDL